MAAVLGSEIEEECGRMLLLIVEMSSAQDAGGPGSTSEACFALPGEDSQTGGRW